MTKIVDVREKEKEVSDIKYQPNQVKYHSQKRRKKRNLQGQKG